MAAKKLSEVPAWASLLIVIASALFAGGAAWGAASYRLSDVDELRSDVTAIRLAVCSMASVQAGAGKDQATALAPALDVCRSR